MPEATNVPERGDITFAPQDRPLRDDVRELGGLVGEMLAEQGGRALLDRVEGIRTAAIERRAAHAGIERLQALLAGVDSATAELVARAFSTWFEVVNVAERVHRIRRRRDYQRAGAATQPESLGAVLETLRSRGVAAAELWGWIQRLDVEPVFTAHPTEAVRRTLLEKEQAIVRALVERFDTSRTPQEDATARARLRMALTTGWQTAEASRVRPTIQDEFEHVGFYLGEPLYQVVPVFYEAFARELARVYGIHETLPRVLRFGSWVGGDMDGNPNVGADTIAATLATQRGMVLERYRDECTRLARLLSQTDDRVETSAAVRDRLVHYRGLLPEASARIRPRHANMPYRCLLTLMAARLAATLAGSDGGYVGVDEFAADLALIAASLGAHRGANAGLFALQRLQLRVRTFGFHLARLDVRQDARVHDDVLAVLLDDAAWVDRPAPERALRLRPLAAGEQAFRERAADPEVDRIRAVFTTLADTHRRLGDDANGPYIISMTRSAADVLAVLALARMGGLVADDGSVPLDVAPLFETIDDLQHAAASLDSLLRDPVYRAHLARRGDQQLIMLGYSDSAKDGGILAARWALQRAQVELLDVARSAGVRLAFFHGRGGSACRGGSKVTPALMASPRGAVAGRLRVTEQGEVIHRKYGIRALALRNLEQTVGATLRASLRPRAAEPRERAWVAAMHELAAASRRAYREFVSAPDFVRYFRTATPVDVIERMTISSRPASRRSMHGVEDLRAIPWVFAWTQMRSILPGWYGLGTALEQGIATIGADSVEEMARDWAFLRTLLDDVEMMLAKCDLDIARSFSELSGDLHARFFPRIVDEFRRTRDTVLRLKHRDRLLADDPRLARSIQLRNPYVDPMSVLQVDLLRRWRAGGSRDDGLLAGLVACVNGVARGLQNTG